MATANIPNVWTQMNYVPPRGQCNFKQSFVSVRCPCLRFMLHPLKVSCPHPNLATFPTPRSSYLFASEQSTDLGTERVKL